MMAVVVLMAMTRMTDAQNGCLVGGWVGCGGGRRRRMVVVVMLMLMVMGKAPQFYIYKLPIDRLSGCYWYLKFTNPKLNL